MHTNLPQQLEGGSLDRYGVLLLESSINLAQRAPNSNMEYVGRLFFKLPSLRDARSIRQPIDTNPPGLLAGLLA